jgi:hypothetical protein
MARDGNYTDDEVHAIIEHALRLQHGRSIDHQQLVAVASEVGISEQDLEAAVHEVRLARESDKAKARILARRRQRLLSHVWTFALVNAFLFAINYLTTPGEWWVLFSVLGWGLALLFHTRAALSKEVSERALRREKKRSKAEQPRRHVATAESSTAPRARIASASLEHGAAELGAAVQDGVGQLLARAAAELRAKTGSPRVRVEGTNARADSGEAPAKARAAHSIDELTEQDEALPRSERRR